MGTLSFYCRAVVDRAFGDHCWKSCPMVFCRCRIAQRWRYRIHNDLLLFRGEIASLVPVVQRESAKPTASGAIKLKVDICKARRVVVATCLFWMSAPRAKQGMQPLFADELHPCSIYGAVRVLEARLRTASCLLHLRRRVAASAHGSLYATNSYGPLLPLTHAGYTAKPPAICETGGFALSLDQLARRSVEAVELEGKWKAAVRPSQYTPALRGLVHIAR